MKRPSREAPGLHISAPSVDERDPRYDQLPSLMELTGNVPTELAGQPTASYACGCGKTGEACGQHAVRALIKDYNDHGRTCPNKTDRPWERHGMPLPPRRNGGRS
jgi:hypothetical protein